MYERDMVGQSLILMNADALMRLWRAQNRRGDEGVKGEVWAVEEGWGYSGRSVSLVSGRKERMNMPSRKRQPMRATAFGRVVRVLM